MLKFAHYANTRKSEQQFLKRYGQEPNSDAQNRSFHYLINTMGDIQRAWELRTELVALDTLKSSKIGIRAAMLQETRFATVWLFPDGPVPIGARQFAMDWRKAIEEPNCIRIVEAFAGGDNEPFKREFATVTELLSDVSGRDLRWFNQFLFRPWGLSVPEDVKLSLEQLGMLEKNSIPVEHRSPMV